MQCSVSGCKVSADSLARQAMNFGQPWPSPAVPVAYRITIEVEEFIKRFKDLYEQAAQEERADIPYHQLGEVPVLDRWQALNYPPLEVLLDQEPALVEGLIQWLDLETLDRLLPGPATGLPRFLVNTIDRAAIVNGWIRIEGRAYSHPGLAQVS